MGGFVPRGQRDGGREMIVKQYRVVSSAAGVYKRGVTVS